MSFIGGGGANIFIDHGQTQGWIWTWNNGGWQGNTFLEAQPLNTDARLACVVGPSSLNNSGTYSFDFSVTNNGPNSTFYNIQTSSN